MDLWKTILLYNPSGFQVPCGSRARRILSRLQPLNFTFWRHVPSLGSASHLNEPGATTQVMNLKPSDYVDKSAGSCSPSLMSRPADIVRWTRTR